MKSRMVAVLVGALGMGLIVVAAGVAGARPGGGGHARQTHRTPPGSVGLKQLTPGLRKLVAAKGLPGPQGSAGRDGAAGAIGAQGPEGGSVGIILTYASGGGPLTLTREGGTTQESIGPLAFDASCEPEGEDTIRATVDVTTSEDGVN